MSKRKYYNITVDADLMKKYKIFVARLEKRHYDLLEEAVPRPTR
jgi:hypothetical protein